MVWKSVCATSVPDYFFKTTFSMFTFAPTLPVFAVEQILVCTMHDHCQGKDRDLISGLADDKLFLNSACAFTVMTTGDI